VNGPVKPPPPASCTTASHQQAMLSTGPAADVVYGVLGCDGHWLVLNVGWPGGPAGCDGPSCSPDLVSTRWFFRVSPHGWETITAARTAGCAQVHKAEPQFPARLCADPPHWDEHGSRTPSPHDTGLGDEQAKAR
jgi:hypothetical protein